MASLHASWGGSQIAGGLGSSGHRPVAQMGRSKSPLLLRCPVGRWGSACPCGAGGLPEPQASAGSMLPLLAAAVPGAPSSWAVLRSCINPKKPGEGHSSPICHRYQIQSCRGQGSGREPSPSQAHTTAGHKGKGREHHAAAALLPSLNSWGNTGLYRLSMTAKKQLTGCRHHVPSPLSPCRCRRMAGSQGPVSAPHCAWLTGWALRDHHCLCANKWLWCHGPGVGPAHGALLREVFRKPLVPQLICGGCVGLAEAGA